jgi:hypothetical protein
MTEPRILIAIKSCRRDQYNGYNDGVRNTWLRDLRGANYCFVLGNGATRLHPDELILDCGDRYEDLPRKTHALCKWNNEHGYDYIFLCDTDTFVVPSRLEGSHDGKDYVGFFNGTIGKPKEVYWCLYAWASGGSGYWLSKRAAQIVSEVNPDAYSMCPETRIPSEDLMIGQILGPYLERGELQAKHDPRFGRSFRDDYMAEISSHYQAVSAGRELPSTWMMKHYELNR